MSLKSELDTNYEMKLEALSNQNKKELVPLNESLNDISKILDFMKNAKNQGNDFSEIKKQIQIQNSELYTEL